MLTATSPDMWRAAVLNRGVWRRALRIGLPVGLLQVIINQGDHWIAGHITSSVIAKTIASPAISVGIALVTAATTVRHQPARPPES